MNSGSRKLSRAFNEHSDVLKCHHRRRVLELSYHKMSKKRVFYYIYDKRLLKISQHIPFISNRAAVVQSLIATYNLFSKCEICPCEEATDEDLLSFHSSTYLECLKKAQTSFDLEKMVDSGEIADFNLGYDCPLFEGIYGFALLIAGSSLTAAKKMVEQSFQLIRTVHTAVNSHPKSYLKYKNDWKVTTKKNLFDATSDFNFEDSVESKRERVVNKTENRVYKTEALPVPTDESPVCINWFGGWHHAQRDEAGGFCYVNDIVIAIQYLLKFYKRVLYIDLDIHHGNGVENAFLFSRRVLTFSIHQYETGFYPTSGSLSDVGKGMGRFYSVNVPLKSGIGDDKYVNVFKRIFQKIMIKYQPECIVTQCGADCLAGDPLGGFNLTLEAIGKCLRMVLDENLPTLVLGGGGYSVPNTARCWAYLTSVILECPISHDIPDNSFLHLYGPGFDLGVSPGLRKDENSDDYLDELVAAVLHHLDGVSRS